MIDPRTREQFERSVLSRLRALGRRVRWYAAVDGLAILGLALVAAMAVTFLVDRTLWLERDMRVVQLVSVLALLAAAAWYWLVRPLRVPVGPQEIALLVERRFPELESRLITAVEFSAPDAAERHTDVARSPELINAVVLQARRAFEPLPLQQTLARGRFRQRASVAFGTLALIAALAVIADGTMSLWFQRNVLLRDVAWPMRHRLHVEGLVDGKLIVPRGDDLAVVAVVDEGYRAPRQVFIEFTGQEGARGRDQMPAEEGQQRPRFTYTFERVSESMTCRVYGGDAPPQMFTIEAIDRPQITGVVMGIVPPQYTRLEAYDLRPGQTVAEALKGSRIRLQIRTNKPVRQAVLVRQTAGQEQELGPAERLGDLEYAASDRPEGSSGYYFRMLDDRDLSNISDRTPPVRMSVRLVPDSPPKVRLKLRGVGEMITPQAVLPVETDLSDTYGLAAARLVYELPGREGFKPVTEPLPGFEAGTRTFSHALEWSAATHSLKEGDRLLLRAEGTDFDDVSGPNVGQSPTFTLRVVNREELLAELNRREQEYRQDFERLTHQQEQLYSELLTLAGLGPGDDPDRARRMAQLARTQRDYAGRVGGMRLQFEQVLSELRVNQLSSPAAESRLGGAIIEPMNALARTQMPAAADLLDRLSRQADALELGEARAAQEAVLADMQRILANMLKWEGFQEAVALLREVLKMQGNLSEETEKRIEREIFGNSPATGPSQP